MHKKLLLSLLVIMGNTLNSAALPSEQEIEEGFVLVELADLREPEEVMMPADPINPLEMTYYDEDESGKLKLEKPYKHNQE
jgi:hypothetical protein